MHGTTGELALSDRHDDGADHGSVKSYLIGFVLSVLLTAVPFALIMTHAVPAAEAIAIALILGVTQMVVHLVYFLHMNAASGRSWNMAALIFTVIILGIIIGGSLWVMHNMNVNMMPGMMSRS
jgi:cytochrome o ubiquinol oxidase operon protein cyoD